MANPVSLRLSEATLERLADRAAGISLAPRTLAQRYIEEGLRMDAHPLVRFADGPAGRRPRLLGSGLDLWEVIATVRDNDGDPAAAAEYLAVPEGLVHAAVAYYGDFTAEIDAWIAANEREAAAGAAAWEAGIAALQR